MTRHWRPFRDRPVFARKLPNWRVEGLGGDLQKASRLFDALGVTRNLRVRPGTEPKWSKLARNAVPAEAGAFARQWIEQETGGRQVPASAPASEGSLK